MLPPQVVAEQKVIVYEVLFPIKMILVTSWEIFLSQRSLDIVFGWMIRQWVYTHCLLYSSLELKDKQNNTDV